MTTPLFETYDQKDVLISPQDQISNFHRNHNAKITKLPSTCILAAMNPNRIERNLQGWKLKRQMQFIPGSPDFPLKIYQKGNKEMLVAYGGMGGAAFGEIPQTEYSAVYLFSLLSTGFRAQT